MKRIYLISIFTVLFLTCSISVFSQTKNPKVIKFFAPKYPLAAQAVRASGTVEVSVKIDKDGKVISANSISGHPLLRNVSENAAKEWIFSNDSTNEEREVKITFLLRLGERNKKDKLKFKKPYTLEVVSARTRIIIDKYPGY